jgi:hypothetical protein
VGTIKTCSPRLPQSRLHQLVPTRDIACIFQSVSHEPCRTQPGRPNSLFCYRHSRYTEYPMNNPSQPNIRLVNAPDYRESYANSVQVRVNVWDFFLVFGTLQQQSETQVEVKNFQGIYLSPQQAKALMSILQQNVSGYESTFGEIKLDPRMTAAGPVH